MIGSVERRCATCHHFRRWLESSVPGVPSAGDCASPAHRIYSPGGAATPVGVSAEHSCSAWMAARELGGVIVTAEALTDEERQILEHPGTIEAIKRSAWKVWSASAQHRSTGAQPLKISIPIALTDFEVIVDPDRYPDCWEVTRRSSRLGLRGGRSFANLLPRNVVDFGARLMRKRQEKCGHS